MRKQIADLKTNEIPAGTPVVFINKYTAERQACKMVACREARVDLDVNHSEGYPFTRTVGFVEWVPETSSELKAGAVIQFKYGVKYGWEWINATILEVIRRPRSLKLRVETEYGDERIIDGKEMRLVS